MPSSVHLIDLLYLKACHSRSKSHVKVSKDVGADSLVVSVLTYSANVLTATRVQFLRPLRSFANPAPLFPANAFLSAPHGPFTLKAKNANNYKKNKNVNKKIK